MSEQQLSTAADGLSKKVRRYTIAEGLGLAVRIRNLTDREKTKYQTATLTEKGFHSKEKAKSQRRRLIVACCVDAADQPLFTEQQLEELEEVDGGVTDWLFFECEKHCWPAGKSAPESAEAA